MDMRRRRFTASLGLAAGALVGPGWITRRTTASQAGSQTAGSPPAGTQPAALPRAAARLSPTKITKIRMFFPPNYDPNGVEDPLREEQFRTQIPKLRLLTTVPLAPGEEWGTRAEFSPLVEDRDIDFAHASLPNVGGITEMLKIMALCDTHRVGIVPHFSGPIATAGHLHTMMAYPGQVLTEFNQGERPVPYLSEFLECRNGKVWPYERPGLGVTVDLAQLTPAGEATTGVPGITSRPPD